MAVSLILIAYLLKKLMEGVIFSKIIALTLSVSIIVFGLLNIYNFFINDFNKPSLDASLFKNEIAVIDYVYQYAAGQNFKAYVFMPSIYDYPYQYLFWWHGQKKYGYIPGEYAYAPNKPTYIPSQNKFQGRKDNFSGLVFLIKEPNRGHNWKSGWEGDFIKYNWETIDKQMIGSIEVEIKREL